MEISTTTPPREIMLRSMRRLRREIWIAQRGWIGRTTMQMSVKIFWYRQAGSPREWGEWRTYQSSRNER
tara:strand:- start:926 stop:1132 length:207 start_codon:yes stop_codon:yes gene_type:complete